MAYLGADNKEVECIHPESGQVLLQFKSAEAASRQLDYKVHPKYIIRCCNGRSDLEGGLLWRFTTMATTTSSNLADVHRIVMQSVNPRYATAPAAFMSGAQYANSRNVDRNVLGGGKQETISRKLPIIGRQYQAEDIPECVDMEVEARQSPGELATSLMQWESRHQPGDDDDDATQKLIHEATTVQMQPGLVITIKLTDAATGKASSKFAAVAQAPSSSAGSLDPTSVSVLCDDVETSVPLSDCSRLIGDDEILRVFTEQNRNVETTIAKIDEQIRDHLHRQWPEDLIVYMLFLLRSHDGDLRPLAALQQLYPFIGLRDVWINFHLFRKEDTVGVSARHSKESLPVFRDNRAFSDAAIKNIRAAFRSADRLAASSFLSLVKETNERLHIAIKDYLDDEPISATSPLVSTSTPAPPPALDVVPTSEDGLSVESAAVEMVVEMVVAKVEEM